MLYRTPRRPASRVRLVAPRRRGPGRDEPWRPSGPRPGRGRVSGLRLPEVSPAAARWLRVLAGMLVIALLFVVLLSAA